MNESLVLKTITSNDSKRDNNISNHNRMLVMVVENGNEKRPPQHLLMANQVEAMR